MVGDRPLGAAKPVDPATRLSELLAQSLEELTRPFDPPRVDPLTRPQPVPQSAPPPSARPASAPVDPVAVHDETEMPVRTESRLDDKALAELEAELFAAASKSATTPPAAATPPDAVTPPEEPPATPAPDAASAAPVVVDPFVDRVEQAAPPEVATPVLTPVPEPEGAPVAATDADTTRLVAKVRRLMLISMAVTVIAVGSVFGFIGYRVFKGEGSVAKTADKVVPITPSAANEITIAIPRGARVVQSSVAEDRLIMTLDVGGRIEVRTYDLKTLQPAGRLTFSTTP